MLSAEEKAHFPGQSQEAIRGLVNRWAESRGTAEPTPQTMALTCQYFYHTSGVETIWEVEDHYQKKMRNRDSPTSRTLFLNRVLMRNKGDKDMLSKPGTRSHRAE